MNMLFFTAFVAIFAVTNGMLVQPRQELEKQNSIHAVQNISPCLLCERVVDEGQKLLAKGATKAEIEKGMRNACDELIGPVVRDECNKLLDEYGNKIIPLLTESVKAVKLCGTFKLC